MFLMFSTGVSSKSTAINLKRDGAESALTPSCGHLQYVTKYFQEVNVKTIVSTSLHLVIGLSPYSER